MMKSLLAQLQRARVGRRRRAPAGAAPQSLASTEAARLMLAAPADAPNVPRPLVGTTQQLVDPGAGKGASTIMSESLSETYLKLVAGTEMPLEDERALLEAIARREPRSLPPLCQLLANQKHQARAELATAREAQRCAEETLTRLREPPWYPADVLRVYADGSLDVAVGGRRQVVAAMPELTGVALRPGDEVFLGRELTAAVARNNEAQHTGVVGIVADTLEGLVILRGSNDEEIVALCAPQLAATLRVGDRVLYKRDTHCIVARLAERTQSPYLLEQPPRVCFSDIGGLDPVIAEIQRDLDLHLLHPELSASYRLRLLRGLTLAGPPGTGKTMLAGAIANYVVEMRPDTRFLHIKPGALRGAYYGESEARIRELFAVARRAPGLVVMFFDELDTFGARGNGLDHAIDDRVMGALLAELDGLETADHILCIGATNRLDLCDDALVRERRFKDRLYHVPRPNRDAGRQVLARYLTPELPYAASGDAEGAAAGAIDAAVGFLYAARGGAAPLATVTLADGTRHEITAPAVLSGALLAGAVERAKHVAAHRQVNGGIGLIAEDVLGALDDALSAEADKIRVPHAARRILDFPGANDIVLVEVAASRRPRRYRYLRAA